MKMIKFVSKLSIRVKFIFVFAFTTSLILFVNIFMYYNINNISRRLDETYTGNVKLNAMADVLEDLQDSMVGYLNTKTSDAMEEYYKNEEEFRKLIGELGTDITDNNMKLMERNIRYMSENYLSLAEKTVDAKRGRNVEKYRTYFDEASALYSYLENYILCLNNEQFRNNNSSYEILSGSLRSLERVSLLVFIALFICSIFLVILVTDTIIKPLHELSAAADQVSSGKLFEVDVVKVFTKDEIGVVTIAFNQMLVSIRNYIVQSRKSMETEQKLKERELKMAAHLKDAQLKYLQAQINPHFLFNTLNAGAQLAMMEDAEHTYSYIQNVADFFRYNIKKDKEVVTLSDEIQIVDNYIYILNVRFSGDIHFSKNIDESLVNEKLPGMILQPVIENAVNYGIRNIDWEGHISLSVQKNGDKIGICIEDNGEGMTKERIDEIMSGQLTRSEEMSNSNGVGLNNVMDRLHLFFDGREQFSITSGGKGLGTRVEIIIPRSEDE